MLKKSRKIAIAAVTAAIAYLCVLVGRFTVVGGFFLLAVAGTMTMLSVRMTGFGYGALSYIAVALLSVTALPFGFFYIILIGPHAVLRGLLFGNPPRKKWRYAVGYTVLTAFSFGISIALYYLAGGVLGAGVKEFIDGILGGVFVFAAVATPIVLIYDTAAVYLSGCLERIVFKQKKKKTPAAPIGDPFAEVDCFAPVPVDDAGVSGASETPPAAADGAPAQNPAAAAEPQAGGKVRVGADAGDGAEPTDGGVGSAPEEKDAGSAPETETLKPTGGAEKDSEK